jgi:hypothetical protein
MGPASKLILGRGSTPAYREASFARAIRCPPRPTAARGLPRAAQKRKLAGIQGDRGEGGPSWPDVGLGRPGDAMYGTVQTSAPQLIPACARHAVDLLGRTRPSGQEDAHARQFLLGPLGSLSQLWVGAQTDRGVNETSPTVGAGRRPHRRIELCRVSGQEAAAHRTWNFLPENAGNSAAGPPRSPWQHRARNLVMGHSAANPGDVVVGRAGDAASWPDHPQGHRPDKLGGRARRPACLRA